MTAAVPQWRFRPMGPGEINVDPIEGEFFSTEALGRELGEGVFA